MARGQDGTLLTQQLRAKDYSVLGIDRGTVECSDGSEWTTVDILDVESVADAVKRFTPEEIYYLAAYHHSSENADLVAPAGIWSESFSVHVRGLINFLEAIRAHVPGARLFYAASALVFGRPEQSPQTETASLDPVCVYGITKTAGVHCCRFYRRHYSVFASVGFLYNHESHLRPESFLSRKIVRAATRIKQGAQRELVLGDLSAERDWGYAPDYVEAMWRILGLQAADDFIIASGRLHRVLDWVEEAFEALGLVWQDHVRQERSLLSREPGKLVGDSSKLRRATGWHPSTSFREMVANMLRLEGDVT